MGKDGFVDFQNLNKSCTNDDFPVSHMEFLIDATIGYEALSFMIWYSGYNQIKMHQEDEEMAAFR